MMGCSTWPLGQAIELTISSPPACLSLALALRMHFQGTNTPVGASFRHNNGVAAFGIDFF